MHKKLLYRYFLLNNPTDKSEHFGKKYAN